jgi:hypothetical protein
MCEIDARAKLLVVEDSVLIIPLEPSGAINSNRGSFEPGSTPTIVFGNGNLSALWSAQPVAARSNTQR